MYAARDRTRGGFELGYLIWGRGGLGRPGVTLLPRLYADINEMGGLRDM